jgi:P27 family predicted phage terminase small subunit
MIGGKKPLPEEISRLGPRRHRRKVGATPVPKTKPIIGCPPPPAHLRSHAAKERRDVTASLAATGMLTATDLVLLESWCIARGDLIDAELQLKRGMIIEDADGNKRRNPWMMVRNRAIDQLRQLAGEFGFSPSSRARLGRPLTNSPPPVNANDEPDIEAYLAEARALEDRKLN